MKIVLIGYMGSGKSTIGKQLAKLLNIQFKDLDQEIERVENKNISEIFSKKGEIYFRKKEMEVLGSVLKEKSNIILATGGGTPCFGNTMELLNSDKKITSIYLKSSIDILSKRLFIEKDERPLISHLHEYEDLKEFISKHLFERSYFYNMACIKIDTDNLTPKEIAVSIKSKLLV